MPLKTSSISRISRSCRTHRSAPCSPTTITCRLKKRENCGSGDKRGRTADFLLAKQALYQLSYGPQKGMVGPGRLELPTSRLSGVRSNQLSYEPMQDTGVSGLTRRHAGLSKIGSSFRIHRSGGRSSSLARLASRKCVDRHHLAISPKGDAGSPKGGDPAAGSPTATLLRLHPNHRTDRWRLSPLRVEAPTSGPSNFRGVTGGVYKARERIHRGMLIRDY